MTNLFAQRLKELRKKKSLSQAQLANLIEVHFAQVSRYERGETMPNATAMTKLAQALETTTDYLMNGTSDDLLANVSLDKEIVSRFKQIQEMELSEKRVIISLLDAYIAKNKIEEILKTK